MMDIKRDIKVYKCPLINIHPVDNIHVLHNKKDCSLTRQQNKLFCIWVLFVAHFRNFYFFQIHKVSLWVYSPYVCNISVANTTWNMLPNVVT